jgi:hypothetical protein
MEMPDFHTSSEFYGLMARTFTYQEDEHWSDVFSDAALRGSCPPEYMED